MGCVLVATAGTLKFLLNWSKIQLTAMAETAWELQNNLFSPGEEPSSCQLPMEVHPDGDFTNAKSKGPEADSPPSLFFHIGLPWEAVSYPVLSLAFCLSELSELAFCNINIKEPSIRQGNGDHLPRRKQLCQINQLQCEAASLEYIYTVL